MKSNSAKAANRKIENLFQKENIWMVVCALSILFLAVYYGSYVSSVTTVWELPDEFGYLANAEFLAKNNWSQLITAYYGYGYSILLIPLFFICKTSVGIIQGAVIVNIICVILTYIISFRLMCKLCQSIEKWQLALVAFLLCLYPYITANVLKVNCECLLSMLVWLAWLLFYECIEKQDMKKYILLAIVLAYTFYTHTRGLALILAMGLLFFFMLFGKNKAVDIKKVLLFLGCFVVLGISGYILKEIIVAGVYSAHVEGAVDETVGNIIGLEWILTRLEWIFSSDFVLYIYSLFCKGFYIGVASLGLGYWALFGGIQRIKKIFKQRDNISSAEWVAIGVVWSFVLMLLMVLVSGAGNLEMVSYFYYGRYYEFMLCPFIFIGIKDCLENGMDKKPFMVIVVIWAMSATGCVLLSDYLTNHSMGLDTARIAAFSFVTQGVDNYAEVVEKLILYSGLGMILVWGLSIKKNMRVMVLIPLFVLFMANNNPGVEAILRSSQGALGDNAIASYLEQYHTDDNIYFVKTNYRYVGYYTKMQVLLGETRMEVVEVSDMESMPSGTYFIGYNSTSGEAQVSGFGELIMEGSAFNLYQMY